MGKVDFAATKEKEDPTSNCCCNDVRFVRIK